ncbi:hypothetical protein BGZ83_012074 [Gryganskiella cystojenkinii]|nr:hypothetical protein BGZ83_012074 [Gryganskiella cystojenkinii]
MFIKFLATTLAVSVALVQAQEVFPCNANTTRGVGGTVASITDANNWCTMLTGYGLAPVATYEGCAESYCVGKVTTEAHPMPAGLILSSHYVSNATRQYVQVTGCMDSTKWALNPTDEGGQMDSHGMPFTCTGYPKFVSLLEPATNTYCIRCCQSTDNSDCNTSVSTAGCWNIIPGDYSMPDGSSCPLAPGAPNSTVTATPTTVTATATSPIATTSGTSGSAPTSSGATTPTNKPSAAAGALKAGSAIAASMAIAVIVAAF